MLFHKLEKIWRLFEKKILFYVIQLLIVTISIYWVEKNFFISWDLNFRRSFIDFRNIIISEEIAEKKQEIVLIWIDGKFFNDEKIPVQLLHRWYYSQAIKNINDAKPSVIWIDIFFQNSINLWNIKDKKNQIVWQIFKSYDNDLANNLQKNNVIAWVFDSKSNSVLHADKIFNKNNPLIWHVTSSQAIYWNITLWISPFFPDKDKTIYPLSLETYIKNETNKLSNLWWYEITPMVSWDNQFINISLLNKTLQIPISTMNWTSRIFKALYSFFWNNSIDWEKYIFTPIYFDNEYKVKYYSIYDIYKWNFDKSDLRNKIVYIWATDVVLNDIKWSLKWNIPWVMVHVNQTMSMLMDDFIYTLNKDQSIYLIIWIILLNLIMIYFFKDSKSNKHIFIILLIELTILTMLWYYLSIWGKLWHMSYSIFLPQWTIITIIFIQMTITLLYSYIAVFFQKENFEKLFSLYVWEKISHKSNKDIDDIGKKLAEEKEVAMFFSDIAWFTNISEKLTPIQNISFINEYLDIMSQEIAINKWFIDKYIWDAIMAFWEEWNWCEFAAKSAIWNIIKLPQVNSKIKDILWDDKIDIRIWLNYWKVIVWDIWSDNYKLNYTIIWDQVNLASRLEWTNKYYHTRIIMSEYFMENIKQNNEFIFRKLDQIKVKWKDNSLTIYELYPIYKSMLPIHQYETIKKFIKEFESWLEQYFLWNFEIALSIFENASKIMIDQATQVFIERCNILIQDKPQDWKWVWKFESK